MSRATNPTVWLHGSYFGENFGDLLLVELFKRKLEASHRPVGLPFASPAALHSLNARRHLLRLPSRVVFSGGGYFGEPSGDTSRWSRRFRLRHGPALWASHQLAKLPPMAVGIGYGPVTDRALKRRIVDLLDSCEICYFRDDESRELFLADGGRERGGLHVTTDGALSLQGARVPEPDDYPTLRRDGRRIALLHVVDEYLDATAIEEVLAATVALVRRHSDQWRFIAITDGRGRGGETAQDRTAARLVAMAAAQGAEIHLRRYTGLWDTVSRIAHADFILTSKLHVGIVGAAYGRNICAIPYHAKTPRFYRHIGQSERCLGGAITRGAVGDHLERWLNNTAPLNLPERVIAASRMNDAAFGPLHDGESGA